MPSHIFWHLSQSWVTIQTRVTGKEFLNQRYQSRVSLRSLNTRYTLLASKGAVHSVFWRNKHAGYILQVWNATDNVYCLRGRWILNLSPPVSPLLSFSQPLAERRPQPGPLCMVWKLEHPCLLDHIPCMAASLPLNWHSAPNVICDISICSSCCFRLRSLSVCLENVNPSPLSTFRLTHQFISSCP